MNPRARTAPVKRARVARASTSAPASLQQPAMNSAISRKNSASKGSVLRSTSRPLQVSNFQAPRMNTSYAGRLASPNDFMAKAQKLHSPHIPANNEVQATHKDKVQKAMTSTSSSSKRRSDGGSTIGQDAISSERPPIPRESPKQVDLMDLDIGQDASHQPVIGFTHAPNSSAVTLTNSSSNHILESFSVPPLIVESLLPVIHSLKAVQATGSLDERQIGMILKDVVNQMKARKAAEVESTKPVLSKKPGKPKMYSSAAMLSLRSKATKAQGEDITNKAKPQSVVASSPVKENKLQNADQQLTRTQEQVLVGEHIHKTRFQHASRDEKSQGETSLQSSLEAFEAKANPFGALKQARIGQASLSKHLTEGAPATNKGEAMSTQHGLETAPHAAGKEVSTSLATNLKDLQLVNGQDAVICVQHESAAVAGSSIDRASDSSISVHPAPLRSARDQDTALRDHHDLTAVVNATGTSNGPRIPSHLANSRPAHDQGAAARAQYSSAANTLIASRDHDLFHSGHFARVQLVTDHGAAARAQYEFTGVTSRGCGALSPYNGQLRSLPSTDREGSTSSSTSRSSMLNKTGFTGLAENRKRVSKVE